MTTQPLDERLDTGRTDRRTFEVRSPATGDLVGIHPVHTEDDVAEAVRRARSAATWWQEIGFAERRRRLDAFRGILTRRIQQIGGLISEETGKPASDSILEVGLVLDHLAWAGKHSEKVLGRKRVRSGALTPHLAGEVEYRPYGVVGVIGPWNFPVFTPLGSIAFALAAGNTVVFKPSEFTPGVGAWLVDAFAQVVPEHPVLQLVTGDGSTGAALARAGVDKLAFTGSTATAKKVMATCAESLTPMVAECGGKDVFIVDEDADLDAAADGAVWSGLMNAGQACIGTERILVHERVYDEFLARLTDRVAGLRAGTDPEARIGPITMPKQVEVIESHLADALARGGRVVAGGGDRVGQVIQPHVLVDVPDDALANTEETFGPTLTVAKVRDMDEAVRRANATTYGLAGTVYGKRGREIARRLETGMVSVNAAFGAAQLATVPFGGVGASGFGRIHGPDGLREFAQTRAVVRQRFTPLLPLTSFGRTAKAEEALLKVLTLVHGRK